MDTIKKLNRAFSTLDFSEQQPYADSLETYKTLAHNYACTENAIAVLSDLRTHVSYIYYGGFAHTLGLGKGQQEAIVSSIWEEEIFKRVHPDDLASKHGQELCFFQLVKRQPSGRRTDYYLSSPLRMKNGKGIYLPVWHRIFYITGPSKGPLWLGLCLYSPWVFGQLTSAVIVNSVTGETVEMGEQQPSDLLSTREKQVLGLIDKGLTSKDIADMLSISVHTVSRHRQTILDKLQVGNSIEACRIAKIGGMI